MTREMEGYGAFFLFFLMEETFLQQAIHSAGLLMLKFHGLYLHSDMLSNGGGGGCGGVRSQGKTVERTILFLSLGWHQTNAVI